MSCRNSSELLSTGGVTTHQDIAIIMGLPMSGSHLGKEVGWILGEISEDETIVGRPMLSAVAVGVNGKAGPGFYALARDLERLTKEDDDAVFCEQERLAAYTAWKRPLPPAK